uniref:Tubulin-specific chaperone A n=1 Tax=Octopus bimaculoides TaxID=37653 RepID=A0A0L8I4S1_OCTBM|eukprot:XP_014790945.1 PREDICTED: uncharacterized protein LOC106884210 [Octopus bimaculoides]
MNSDIVKELEVKAGVLQQFIHEKSSYEVELKQDMQRLDKMKETNEDERDIAEQEDMMREAKNMIFETMRRLEVAYDDLKTFHDKVQQELSEIPSFLAAQEVLLSAQNILNH